MEIFTPENVSHGSWNWTPRDSRGIAYIAYAHFRFVFEGFSTDPEADFADALKYARRAVELDDADPVAHFAYSVGLTFSGRPAIREYPRPAALLS